MGIPTTSVSPTALQSPRATTPIVPSTSRSRSSRLALTLARFSLYHEPDEDVLAWGDRPPDEVAALLDKRGPRLLLDREARRSSVLGGPATPRRTVTSHPRSDDQLGALVEDRRRPTTSDA